MPAEADVFSNPAPTALNRTREKRLNDFAKNASDESSAAFTGAMKPYCSAAMRVVEIEIATTEASGSSDFSNALASAINEKHETSTDRKNACRSVWWNGRGTSS